MKKCQHFNHEQLIDYMGIEVYKCYDACGQIYLVEGDVDSEIYDYPQHHYNKAIAEANRYLALMDEYLREHAPPERYKLWRSLVERGVPVNFCVLSPKDSDREYLKLTFIDASRRELENIRAKGNVRTSRSFGRLERYPDVGKLLHWQEMYTAWKRVASYIANIMRALGMEVE